MITTLNPILEAVSRKLKESSTDTSLLRIGYVNDAIRYVLGLYKWGWSIKRHQLNVLPNVQEYLLTSEISDYSPIRGIYEVYFGGTKIGPITYNAKSNISSLHFYLKPDNKTIGFTKKIDGTETIEIWYYPEWTDVNSTSTTFSVPIPPSMVELISLYVKYLVHEGKRQRYDSRNALLDFKQALDTLIPQSGSAKIKDQPKRLYNFFSYMGFRRRY